MTLVTAVLAHVDADEVHERFALLRAVAPEERFVLCYGGPAETFAEIDIDDKVFIDDPSLRGPAQHLQSLTLTFERVWEEYVAQDEAVTAVYLIEYDHLILDPRFAVGLGALAAEAGADVLGKNCADRTATNEEHYVRWRRSAALLAHLRAVSVRDDPERIYGCLGNGIWLTREALAAYVAVGEHPPCYCEIYVPTLLHHLGFRVRDVDAHATLYDHVRWTPPYDRAEIRAARDRGVAFMHPVKDRAAVAELLAAATPSSTP